MAQAVLFQQRVRQALEAALLAVDGTVTEWRTDLRAAIHDHFKSPGDVQPQESPWLFLTSGDFDLKTQASQLLQGEGETLIYGVFVADRGRTGTKTAREGTEELVGDVRKRIEQVANIDGWYVYTGMRADVTVDPEGAFGMFLATVTHRVRVRLAL